jgi:hypothetical protein
VRAPDVTIPLCKEIQPLLTRILQIPSVMSMVPWCRALNFIIGAASINGAGDLEETSPVTVHINACEILLNFLQPFSLYQIVHRDMDTYLFDMFINNSCEKLFFCSYFFPIFAIILSFRQI